MIDSDGVRLAPQLLALSLALAACADPFAAATFGPQEVVLDALEVEIDFSPMGPPGTLNIQSRSIGGHALSFGFSDHLEMIASTSAGDFEILQLWPRNCRTERLAPGMGPGTGLYRCGLFSVTTESVAAFDKLRPLIAELPGTILGNGLCSPVDVVCPDRQSTYRSIRIPDRNIFPAMKIVQQWPGVIEVHPFSVNLQSWAPPYEEVFTGSTILEISEAVSGDGRLQIRAGGTITLIYEQPDGSLNEAIVIVR